MANDPKPRVEILGDDVSAGVDHTPTASETVDTVTEDNPSNESDKNSGGASGVTDPKTNPHDKPVNKEAAIKITGKPIMHIMVGDDKWQPSDAELKELISLFNSADEGGAYNMVATRNNIKSVVYNP